MKMTVKNDKIDVFIAPHPFRASREHRAVAAGKSVAAIVAELQPDAGLREHAHVTIGGDVVPRDDWARVKPKAGTQLAIRMVPMGGGGGGGKNPLRTVMSLAIMSATGDIAGGLLKTGLFSGGFMGFGLGGLVKAGLGMAGRLLLNAIAPPAAPRFQLTQKQSPTLFIQGAQNKSAPFSRVPKVLGQHRYVPLLGASPYTETVGGDQYLRMLFVWGYGPLEITDIKIGETPITDFTDVEIETRQGYDTDAPLTLYTNSVVQNNLQVALTNAAGYLTRTTDTDATAISVDITFPQGLFQINDSNVKVAAAVEVSVDYAPAGSGAWTSAGSISVTAEQSATLLKGLQFSVPAAGQYDVRLMRVTPDSASDLVYDDVVWTALRTIRSSAPVNMTGLAMTALRIKATDQLNGVIDRLNGVVQSIVPDWNGTAWDNPADQTTWHATANPASLYRHVLQGSANARPLDDTRLDLATLQTWHDDCAAASREFNAVIDYDISVADVLQDIAAAGRASPTLIDGCWGVVEDAPQTSAVQHFTPRNSFTFSGNKAFADQPQALRVRFINRDNGWLQDERIVYDDGFDASNTTVYEVLELPGVTSSDQAWKDGRYHIATARLRPETYSFYADIEHIVATRGDLIRFTHDVPLFGLMSARVKSVASSGGFVTGVTLDADVTMTAGTSYAVRFRLGDGSSLVQTLTTVAGSGNDLTFATPLATSAAPAVGDLALFGISGQESVELVVKSITPQNDLNALIVCVDYAPGVFTADSGTIPAFSSQISLPPEMLPLPVPVLSQIQSGTATMIKNADGTFTDRVVVTLAAPSYNGALGIKALVRAGAETDFHPATVVSATANSVSLAGLASGGLYDIRVYYVSGDGQASSALTVAGYRVAADMPSDVTGFYIGVLGDTAHLAWNAVTDIDLAGYAIRFAPQTAGVTWAGATDLITQIPAGATGVSVPAAAGTYLIKAVSASGLTSVNAALAVSTVSAANATYILTVTEDSGFTGANACTGTDAGALRLSGADTVDVWADFDLVADADIGNAGMATAGTYGFAGGVDLGAVFTSRLTVDMAVAGLDTTTSVDSWADIDNQESFDQTVDPSLWNVAVQIRATNGDPAASPVWSNWQPFVIGDYSARAYEFQAVLTSDLQGVTPAVTRLRVDLDMPGRDESACGVAAPAGGASVAYASPFRATPAVSVTAQDMGSGDYYVLTPSTASGFTVKFFDAAGTGVSRTFDWLAKGYGQQS